MTCSSQILECSVTTPESLCLSQGRNTYVRGDWSLHPAEESSAIPITLRSCSHVCYLEFFIYSKIHTDVLLSLPLHSCKLQLTCTEFWRMGFGVQQNIYYLEVRYMLSRPFYHIQKFKTLVNTACFIHSFFACHL